MAENVMVRAAMACDVVITLVMLFMALAFGLIAVVGSLSIIQGYDNGHYVFCEV